MSEKTARVKLMLNSSSFLGGLQQVSQQIVEHGKRWGAALKDPAIQGITSMRESLKGTIGQAQSLASTALGIAGGFSAAAGASGAMALEDRYRELAFAIQQASGETTKWQDVQSRIEPAADAAKRTSGEMAGAFDKMLEKSGDAAYSANALLLVGEAMNATGRSGEELGNIVGTLHKKWGITEMEDVRAALLQVFEATKGGKIRFEELAEDLDELGSIAGSAGMEGMDGFRRAIGAAAAIAPNVNQSISEVLTGMDQLTEKMRQQNVVEGLANAGKFAGLGKFAGSKFFEGFTAQHDVTKRIGMLLEGAGKKGAVSSFMRSALEVEFTGREERAAFEALATPFKVAYEEARAAGKSTEEATKVGVAAFDAGIAKLGQSTGKWSDIQTRAADNQNATSAKIRQAQEMFQRAFTDPKTMKAMGELAEKLPALAEGIATLIRYTVENPLLSGAALVGGKAALSGISTFTTEITKSALVATFGSVATQGGAAAAGLAGVQSSTNLATKAINGLANASGMEGIVGKGAAAASTAAALLAVGTAAYEVTTKLLEMRDASEQKGKKKANDIFFETSDRMGKATTREERARILKEGEQKLTESVGFFDSPEAATRSIKALRETKENLDVGQLTAGAKVFEETMSRSADTSAQSLERAARSAERVANAFNRVAPPSGSNGLPPTSSKAPGFWDN